ncbi:MAG: DsbA family protein [Acidimicrobiales bacterium]
MTAIEMYADIWCPFSHVGLRSVVRRRDEQGRSDVVLRVRAWPLELVNGAPVDPTMTAGHVQALQAQVVPNLFARFDPGHFPRTTLPALAVEAAAYRQDERTGEAVSLALRDALFEQGRDVSHPDVLAEVAGAFGVSPAGPEDERAVLADWHEGQARGVKGSPHFFCGLSDVFCPSLDIARDAEGNMEVRFDTEALDAFLTDCLGT